jgi:hypothetical protein
MQGIEEALEAVREAVPSVPSMPELPPMPPMPDIPTEQLTADATAALTELLANAPALGGAGLLLGLGVGLASPKVMRHFCGAALQVHVAL